MTGNATLFDQAEEREFHPLTRILPPVTAGEDVISAIAASLAAGSNYLQMHPMTLDQLGRIVDGRLR